MLTWSWGLPRRVPQQDGDRYRREPRHGSISTRTTCATQMLTVDVYLDIMNVMSVILEVENVSLEIIARWHSRGCHQADFYPLN